MTQPKKKNSSGLKSWGHLKQKSPDPKGPEKPWKEGMEQAAEEFVAFLQDSGAKETLKDFLLEAYKKYEADKIARIRTRVETESRLAQDPNHPQHEPGNIEPMMHGELNMTETEQAFARGLRGTQTNLIQSIEERVEEINRLLSDIGGFSAQLKSSFARSTVVFLEQEDPQYSFRERLIFSINLPNYELKRQWERSSGKGKKTARTADGRSSLQVTWDEAVNALARIVETTGLKPKYCKNDRHFGRFVMKQDLRSTTHIPDEYFSFTLDYNTQEKINEMKAPYEKVVADYESQIKKLSQQMKQYPENSKDPKFQKIKKKHLYLCQDRDFFVGTTPDPNQLDEGLLFLIEVSTLKDYHIVKDRMQSIMTRYILYLSKIAEKEAEGDKSMEYDLAKAKGEPKSQVQWAEEELAGVPEYLVEKTQLKKKKIA